MNYELLPLNCTKLTYVEFSDLIFSHKKDIVANGFKRIEDTPLVNFINVLFEKLAFYQKSFSEIKLKDEVKLIFYSDSNRDDAILGLNASVMKFLKSDKPIEVEMARSLLNLISKYCTSTKESYADETLCIDKLICDLESPIYERNLMRLQLDHHLFRLKEANSVFKKVYDNHIMTGSLTELYRIKLIRNDLFKYYELMNNYLLFMVNLRKTEQFVKLLSLINLVRGRYADMIMRREVSVNRKVVSREIAHVLTL